MMVSVHASGEVDRGPVKPKIINLACIIKEKEQRQVGSESE